MNEKFNINSEDNLQNIKNEDAEAEDFRKMFIHAEKARQEKAEENRKKALENIQNGANGKTLKKSADADLLDVPEDNALSLAQEEKVVDFDEPQPQKIILDNAPGQGYKEIAQPAGNIIIPKVFIDSGWKQGGMAGSTDLEKVKKAQEQENAFKPKVKAVENTPVLESQADKEKVFNEWDKVAQTLVPEKKQEKEEHTETDLRDIQNEIKHDDVIEVQKIEQSKKQEKPVNVVIDSGSEIKEQENMKGKSEDRNKVHIDYVKQAQKLQEIKEEQAQKKKENEDAWDQFFRSDEFGGQAGFRGSKNYNTRREMRESLDRKVQYKTRLDADVARLKEDSEKQTEESVVGVEEAEKKQVENSVKLSQEVDKVPMEEVRSDEIEPEVNPFAWLSNEAEEPIDLSEEKFDIREYIKVDPEIASKFQERFGITQVDLASIQGFNEQAEGKKHLSVGQQHLVLENLSQIMLARVKEGALSGRDEKQEQKKKMENMWEQIKSLAKNAVTFGYASRAEIAKLESLSAEKLRHGGMTEHGAILQELVSGMQNYGPDAVLRKDGSLEIHFASHNVLEENIGRSFSDDETKALMQFNERAQDYAETGVSKKHSRKEKANIYHICLEYLIDKLEVNLSKDKQQNLLQYILQVDREVEMNRLLNTHPQAERELERMSSNSGLMRGLHIFGGLFKERGMAFGSGFLTRSATVGTLGALGLPGAVVGWSAVITGGATVGYLQARRRAYEALDIKDRNARAGELAQEKYEIEQGARAGEKIIRHERHFVSAKAMSLGIQNLIKKLEGGDETVKVKTKAQLEYLVGYADEKLRNGLVNFGTVDNNKHDKKIGHGEQLARQYEFMKTLGAGAVMVDWEGYFNGTDGSAIERVDELLNFQKKDIKDRDKRAIRRTVGVGAVLGASFAVGGGAMRDYAVAHTLGDSGNIVSGNGALKHPQNSNVEPQASVSQERQELDTKTEDLLKKVKQLQQEAVKDARVEDSQIGVSLIELSQTEKMKYNSLLFLMEQRLQRVISSDESTFADVYHQAHHDLTDALNDKPLNERLAILEYMRGLRQYQGKSLGNIIQEVQKETAIGSKIIEPSELSAPNTQGGKTPIEFDVPGAKQSADVVPVEETQLSYVVPKETIASYEQVAENSLKQQIELRDQANTVGQESGEFNTSTADIDTSNGKETELELQGIDRAENQENKWNSVLDDLGIKKSNISYNEAYEAGFNVDKDMTSAEKMMIVFLNKHHEVFKQGDTAKRFFTDVLSREPERLRIQLDFLEQNHMSADNRDAFASALELSERMEQGHLLALGAPERFYEFVYEHYPMVGGIKNSEYQTYILQLISTGGKHPSALENLVGTISGNSSISGFTGNFDPKQEHLQIDFFVRGGLSPVKLHIEKGLISVDGHGRANWPMVNFRQSALPLTDDSLREALAYIKRTDGKGAIRFINIPQGTSKLAHV